ncbi:hypothetical protein [Phyllobacterium zundukense]|uniref:hypothetical protein n=1 Tax=Phyllobacterium zundukense TaxID=1867719 RepID=UPI003965BAEA
MHEVREETALSYDRLYADICEQFYEANRNSISMLPVFVGFVDADGKVVINDEQRVLMDFVRCGLGNGAICETAPCAKAY